LRELLELIVAGKLVGDALKEAKKKIKELWERKEYGFTPDPELASKLQRISKNDAYNRMKELIGNHPFLSLVRLGLVFAEISEEGEAEKIARVKREVHHIYGIKGVRVLTMGSTGVLLDVIRYLSDLKIKYNNPLVSRPLKFASIHSHSHCLSRSFLFHQKYLCSYSLIQN